MQSEILADISFLTARLLDTAYSYLLIDPTTSAVGLSRLNLSTAERKTILRYPRHINDIGRKAFFICGDTLILRADAVSEVKPFVQMQFIRLLAPPCYPNEANFRAFLERYKTKNSYKAETLQLFSRMTDRLCGIKMTLPPFGTRVGLSEFVNCTLCHARAWRRIGSDLCNGVLRPGDDVTAYFSDASQAYTQIDTCNSLFRIPALLDAIDGRLVVSTAFSENPSAYCRIVSRYSILPMPPVRCAGFCCLLACRKAACYRRLSVAVKSGNASFSRGRS